METTEYDLYDLLIGDDDISGIGDGSVTGAISSLDNSITNLIKVQDVSLYFETVTGGATSTKTATVTACPTGYSTMIIPKASFKCLVSSSDLNGTTLSITIQNPTSSSTTGWARVYVVYYPSTWNI